MNVGSVYKDKDGDTIVSVVDHLKIYRIDDTDYLKLMEFSFEPTNKSKSNRFKKFICLNVSNNKKQIRIFDELNDKNSKEVLKAYQIPLKLTIQNNYYHEYVQQFGWLKTIYEIKKEFKNITVGRVGLNITFQIGKNKYVKRKDSNSRTHILEMKSCNFVNLDSNILIDKIVNQKSEVK